ncbi:MAG: precorrin-6y C5,15-methyltransferase (decarboxylating) subunit CbiE [Thermoleophilia bacterium]
MTASPAERLVVVGVGPAAGYLTPAAARLIRSCEVFVGGDAALAAAPAWGRRIRVAGPLDPILDEIERLLEQGEPVCVLTSGDPGYFGMLAAVERRFPGRAVVEPGVSSVQLLAARLGLPWQELRHVSVHGRPLDSLEWTGGPVAVLCGGENTPTAVAARLRAAGEDLRIGVGVAVGGLEEMIVVADPATIAETAFGTPAVMIAAPVRWLAEGGHTMQVRGGRRSEPEVAAQVPPGAGAPTAESFPGAGSPPPPAPLPAPATPRSPARGAAASRPACPAPGIPDDEFVRLEGVPLSRWEVRAVLARVARAHERRVIWDVGAGSGGFAVEMALLAPDARVVAFERDPDGCEATRMNAERFGARVEVVEGEAPDVLEHLGGEDRPDLIIVGGSGGRLEEILETVGGWLRPGGRIVVTSVTLETAGTAARVLSWEPWAGHDAIQMATARLDRAGIMRGANPITILWADKENHQ